MNDLEKIPKPLRNIPWESMTDVSVFEDGDELLILAPNYAEKYEVAHVIVDADVYCNILRIPHTQEYSDWDVYEIAYYVKL